MSETNELWRAPTVSVILPTFNRAGTLRRAIDSVLDQSYTDRELIVVDDGSTDGTDLVIAEHYATAGLRYIRLPHRGPSATRNAGIAAARGRFIAFQDDDDQWLPGRLERTVAALEAAGPSVGLCYSDMIYVRHNGQEDDYASPDVVRGGLFDDGRNTYQVEGIGIQSALIRRECLEDVGGFDESLPRFVDMELFIRLSQRYDFLHLKVPLVRYYQNQGISTNVEAMIRARRSLLRRYAGRVKPRHVAFQHLFTAEAIAKSDRHRFWHTLPWAGRALLAAPWHRKSRRLALSYFSWAARGALGTAGRWLSPRSLGSPRSKGREGEPTGPRSRR